MNRHNYLINTDKLRGLEFIDRLVFEKGTIHIFRFYSKLLSMNLKLLSS